MSSRPVILTMKWGSLFGVEEVNVLYRACRAQSRMAFDFVCMTDNAEGLDPEIVARPLPEIGLDPGEWYEKGVWPKLSVYKADLQGLTGRCLFIDIDMMVLRDLDDFFQYPAPFVSTDMGASWYPGTPRSEPEAGTCIFAFDLGRESQILEAFLRDRSKAKEVYLNEQDFVAAYASSMDYWPEGWVISFKRWLRQPVGLDLFFPPKPPPDTARVLAFHGRPRPATLLKGGINIWDRFPHMGNGQVKWMVDYWKRYGGRV